MIDSPEVVSCIHLHSSKSVIVGIIVLLRVVLFFAGGLLYLESVSFIFAKE